MKTKPEIHDPSQKTVQVILTDAFQLGYLLERLLGFTGAADITVSTFSTGEEFLRKLIALRRIGLIRTARLFTDFKAAEKTAKINAMLRAAYDEVRFCKNHSKVIIIEGITPPFWSWRAKTKRAVTASRTTQSYNPGKQQIIALQLLTHLQLTD